MTPGFDEMRYNLVRTDWSIILVLFTATNKKNVCVCVCMYTYVNMYVYKCTIYYNYVPIIIINEYFVADVFLYKLILIVYSLKFSVLIISYLF